MPFNLLTEAWIPVRTVDDSRRWLSPRDLFAAEDVVAPAWPRADFNTATSEFLIGLASVVLAPEDEDDWQTVWSRPPADWAARLEPLCAAFNLDGEGPRFMQEYGGLQGAPSPVEALMVDTPGAQGRQRNTDLLTHRGRYPALGLPAAAIALYTLQTVAPAGGRGNRTSLRGGGPLTVLVLPQAPRGHAPRPLWRCIWANVCPVEAPPEDIADVFPWLRPHPEDCGKVSETSPGFHPLHAFFGMPRRMWLTFGNGRCAMTGREGPVATGFVQRPEGFDYDLWHHPLTPYRRQKEDAPPYPTKPKSGMFSLSDWVAAVIGNGPLREPARVMTLARGPERRDALCEGGAVDPRLLAAGWAMDNMEARAYLWAELPLHMSPDEARTRTLDALARALAETGELVADQTVRALYRALDPDGRVKLKRDSGLFRTAARDLLERADVPFHTILDSALQAPDPGSGAHLAAFGEQWRQTLRRVAFETFDTTLPVPVTNPLAARPIVEARGKLGAVLDGYREPASKLFARLGLPSPIEARKRKRTS